MFRFPRGLTEVPGHGYTSQVVPGHSCRWVVVGMECPDCHLGDVTPRGDEGDLAMQLQNDTRINVAQLMKDDLGAARKYTASLNWFSLDDDLMAKDVQADIRLTRIIDGILATGNVRGIALVECVRCLEIYEQPFAASFDQEYRPTIDVRSGLLVEQPDPDEELGTIDEAHELDLSEPMRQVAILDLPIRPVCGDDCEGIREFAVERDDAIDRRLSALSQLLDDDADEMDTSETDAASGEATAR